MEKAKRRDAEVAEWSAEEMKRSKVARYLRERMRMSKRMRSG